MTKIKIRKSGSQSKSVGKGNSLDAGNATGLALGNQQNIQLLQRE
jgi:hypothetical protein